MFFGLGCVTLLAATFGVGVMVGRHSNRTTLRSVGSADSPRVDNAGLAAPPTPPLTFYRELTAPLDEVRPKGGSSVGRRARSLEGGGESRETSRSSGVNGSAFTVQVGAYQTRAPAEALRATLAASGHDAYVEEAAGPGGVRYRVRVGSFPSRQAASEAATRLARERQLATYVSPR